MLMPKRNILGRQILLPYHPTFKASPKKFHSPEAKLEDCFISLNQSLSPDNRLVQLDSF